MILRDAQPSDFAAVRRLLGQLGYAPDEAEFRHRFESVMAAAGHRIVVAEEGGAIVGVLHVFERPALDKGCEAVVQALVVDDTLRGRGIGEALMREAEAWAAHCGLGATSLYTNVTRHRARASASELPTKVGSFRLEPDDIEFGRELLAVLDVWLGRIFFFDQR